MARIDRLYQMVFGNSAGFQEIAQFGTLAAGSPAFATSPSQIQKTNWNGGWFSAVLGGNSPAIEDMNAFCFLTTSQLAYIFQEGVPSWDAQTTYYQGCIINYLGIIFLSKTNTNLNNNPLTDTTNWGQLFLLRNYLINGAFDFFQRGSSIAVVTGNPTYGYVADRWYLKNNNSGATLTGASVASTIIESVTDLKCTYGASATTNGMELYQALENSASMDFYAKHASFTAQIKGFGNINQVGIQFYYATSETKLTTAIGSEILTTVNSSTYTTCQIDGQFMGGSMTTSGVVGIRIRPTGASSGNIYASGNGFVVGQTNMTQSFVAPIAFQRACVTNQQELAMCQRFYEKSYAVGTDPGSVTALGEHYSYLSDALANGGAIAPSLYFSIPKRSVPTMGWYSPATGTALRAQLNGSTDFAVATSSSITNQRATLPNNNSGGSVGGAGSQIEYQWTADSEI